MVFPNTRGSNITFHLFRRVIQLIVGAIFVISLAGCTPTFNWAFKAGGSGTDLGTSIVIDTAGNLYVTRQFSGAVSTGSGGLSRPIGLGFEPDGNLYVSSSGTSQIIRYNGTTGAFIDVYASGGGLIAPSCLVFGR